MVKHMPTDILGSIMYNGFATGFGPTTPFAAAGTWVLPSSYFSARGPSPFVPMGPPPPMSFAPIGSPPQTGSHAAAEAGPSHSRYPSPSAIPGALYHWFN